jgi:hypothetical protein
MLAPIIRLEEPIFRMEANPFSLREEALELPLILERRRLRNGLALPYPTTALTALGPRKSPALAFLSFVSKNPQSAANLRASPGNGLGLIGDYSVSYVLTRLRSAPTPLIAKYPTLPCCDVNNDVDRSWLTQE